MSSLLYNPVNVYILGSIFIVLIILQLIVLSGRGRLYFDRIRIYYDILELTLLLFYFVYLYRLFHLLCDDVLGVECRTVHPGARRYIAFIILLISTFVLYKKTGRAYVLSHLIPCMLILPASEEIFGDHFPFIMYISVIGLIIRALLRIIQVIAGVRFGFYALSIRDALSEVDAGLLFCRTNGMPIFVNDKMYYFASQLDINSRINGLKLYDEIMSRKEPFPVADEFPIAAMKDGTYRMVSRYDITILNRAYILITATDVTQFVIALRELESVRKTLEERQYELNAHLQNIVEYAEKEAASAMRMRAHDLLGERLSIILHSIREGHENIDMDKLAERLREAVDAIKNRIPESTPEERYASVSDAFAEMGVELILDGHIPPAPYIGNVLVELIREAVTNAVRHAYATKIYIKCYYTPEGFRVSITNNGNPCTKAIHEGNGIRGMRKKVTFIGGIMTVMTQPEFTISILLPSDR